MKKGRMLREDGDGWAAYLRWLANAMELRDWEVAYSQDRPDSENALAEAFCTYGRKHVKIKICKDWDDRTADEQRHVCVHELVHAHIAPMQFASNNARPALGEIAFGVFEGGFRDAMEYAIDALADALAKHLPLPWEEKSPRKRIGNAKEGA